ncbi:MAG: hypothetical protein R3245_04420 [Kiloniellales bacterium]|nr:hypothetical protein [Kiloniellales bacterium]
MTSCEIAKQHLADMDPEEWSELPPEIKAHVESCDSCRALRAKLEILKESFADLEEYDASDELVEATLEAVHQAKIEPLTHAPRWNRRHALAGSLAASLVVAAIFGITMTLPGGPTKIATLESQPVGGSSSSRSSEQVAMSPAAPPVPAEAELESELAARDVAEGFSSADELVLGDRAGQGGYADNSFERSEIAQTKDDDGDVGRRLARRDEQELDIIAQLSEEPVFSNTESPSREKSDAAGAKLKGAGESRYRQTKTPLSGPQPEGEDESDIYFGEGAKAPDQQRAGSIDPSYEEQVPAVSGQIVEDAREAYGLEAEPQSSLRSQSETKPAARDHKEDAPASVVANGPGIADPGADSNKAVARELEERADEVAPLAKSEAGADLERPANEPIGGLVLSDEEENFRQNLQKNRAVSTAALTAEAFLQDYQRLEGLTFQEPVGYWANSYIPGDPAIRLLETRLKAWEGSDAGQDFRVPQNVHQIAQPFDAPSDAALGLFLSSDRASLSEDGRVRLQIGLKGAERQGGHRPAMNVALVLDLREEIDTQTAQRIGALITAMNSARQAEDRFSLTIAGPGGGLLVTPEDFRHGALKVVMDDLLAKEGQRRGEVLALPDALVKASENLRLGDDPNAVLGSSLLLLVTGSSLSENLETLERMAFENAVQGLPLSVVSLGRQEDPQDVERLVAAGQGNRRVLGRADEAEGLIDRELHASSRAVARALRLRIRLAPGVELVDVLGSRRLGEPQAERVREAEVAIDKRLARNLGIEADRGEDEEGIQIVIPHFYAGDSHTILLDLVAEGPGPIGDVTVRYKDLVQLKNGVARAGLSLKSGEAAAGPLELNVLKNLVAWTFSEKAEAAGTLLLRGDKDGAKALLTGMRDLLEGLRAQVPGWSAEPDLIADESLLSAYIAMLDEPRANGHAEQRYLADSLNYDAFRKLQSAQR